MPEAEADLHGLVEGMLIYILKTNGDEKEKRPKAERCAIFCASFAATSKHPSCRVKDKPRQAVTPVRYDAVVRDSDRSRGNHDQNL